jgi:hypothetical protein
MNDDIYETKTFTIDEIKSIILQWDGIMTDDLVNLFEERI